MRDRYYFPLAAMLIGAIVYFAVNAGGPQTVLTPEDIIRDGYEVAGGDLRQLTASPGTSFTIVEGSEGVYASLKANISQDTPPPSAGVFVTLGPELEAVFANRKIRVTLKVRAYADAPSPAFKSNYFTVDAGASGWKNFEPRSEFENFSFEYTPSPVKTDLGVDYLGIYPDIEGLGRGIDVASIRIDVTD